MPAYLTSTGGRVTAADIEAATELAAQYGMGEIVGEAQDAPRRRRRASMSLARARGLYDMAHDFPRHGEGWPANAQERLADEVLRREGVLS